MPRIKHPWTSQTPRVMLARLMSESHGLLKVSLSKVPSIVAYHPSQSLGVLVRLFV